MATGATVSPSEEATLQLNYGYRAHWTYDDVKKSTDPHAVPFGFKPWAWPQGLIRPILLPGEADYGSDDFKPVDYVPVKRTQGQDDPPTLGIAISLLPKVGGANAAVKAWVGTTVEVKVVNLLRRHANGLSPSIVFKTTLGADLSCKITMLPSEVMNWLQTNAPLDVVVNDNLLDFEFNMFGVDDNGSHLRGQAQKRIFLYCRKTFVFLPGLFGSKIRFPDANGDMVGFPDFWERLPVQVPVVGKAEIASNALFQRAEMLECDDKGVPLIPCPKPALLMMSSPLIHFGAAVIDPFVSLHNARMKFLGRAPEKFLLYELRVFAYDWRADLTDAAARLIYYLTDLQKTVLRPDGDQDDQVAIAGHSTGGVVIRRALAHVAASECTPGLEAGVKAEGNRAAPDTLISLAFFLSVPFSGAPKAGAVLMTGRQEPYDGRMIPMIVPESLVNVALTMPVVYHLHTSAQYPHRPSTSPSRPPGAPRDNEADKAAFVNDLVSSGLMMRPWPVRSELATTPDARRQLATTSAAWHEILALDFQSHGGVSPFWEYNAGGADRHAFIEKVSADRGLSYQMKARAPAGGWSDYLAGRAKTFHAASVKSITAAWKPRTCIVWGSCLDKTTLRQLNLRKVDTELIPNALDYLQAYTALSPETEGGRAALEAPEVSHYDGDPIVAGRSLINLWKMKGDGLVRTGWELEWFAQNGTGDTTVPSDSQLAEQDRVGAIWLTSSASEAAPIHMASTKVDKFWEGVLLSMHHGKLLPEIEPEKTFRDRHGFLYPTAAPLGYPFNE